MNKIKGIFKRETVLYLVFGALTTLVNFVIFWIFNKILAMPLISNAIAFAGAVIFAFITNKLFVFESKSWGLATLKREIPGFIGARLFSFALEEAGLWVATLLNAQDFEALGMDGILIAKGILAVVIVVLNYIFGKIIFKKKSID